MADIQASYEKLQSGGGYQALDKFPSDFQSLDLPKLAGEGGKVTLQANDQAYFLAPDAKGDTGHLKELFKKIYENNTQFTMMIDADALGDAKRFGDKQHVNTETELHGVREARLAAEAKSVQDFVNGNGIDKVAKEVVGEELRAKAGAGSTVSENEINDATAKFLKENFKLAAIETNGKRLENAVWEVEAKTADGQKDPLLARQDYGTGKWQLGTQDELNKLEKSGQTKTESERTAEEKGAAQVLKAVEEMHGSNPSDATHGLRQGKAENTSPAADLHARLSEIASLGAAAAMLGKAVPVENHNAALSGPKNISVNIQLG